ncbi:MAG: ribosomal protein L11 methyltransferase [Methanobacterium sp. PtaU1.Bin242]|nr:MAG: ribosomal protein L11 methyltransferase [Methanobacterium sp. PtaU1.Bin242]
MCTLIVLIKNMELRCTCGRDCIKPASEVLKDLKDFYNPCDNCKEYKLKKFTPLTQQINLRRLNDDFGRCVCRKRHLDLVMAHILQIMIDEGFKDKKSTLRDVCVPLITPAYPLNSVPYLQEDSLVILSGDVSKNCAQRIVKEVSEVKGVLKGYLKDTVGIKDFESVANTYDVLAGCDLRCDIVNTPWGNLCIYKHQGQIHIELPKPLSPKIKYLKKVLDNYNKPKIVDCTCGPGTLGIAALKAGASKVVFNDIWYPACQTTAMNLEINGFPVELRGNKKGLIADGDNFKVYCMDIQYLKTVLDEKFEVCLVDVFPGVDSTEFVNSIRNICREVVLID